MLFLNVFVMRLLGVFKFFKTTPSLSHFHLVFILAMMTSAPKYLPNAAVLQYGPLIDLTSAFLYQKGFIKPFTK